MSLYNKDTDGDYTKELEGNTAEKSGQFNGIVDAIYRITTKLNALTESINNSDNIADSPKRLNTIRQNIEHIIREAYFDDAYVIDVEGEVKGITPGEDKNVEMLSCWSRELVPSAEIARLCVRKDMQNQGIAKEMMQYVFEILKEEGKKGVHILVKTGHEAALSSYRAIGFRVVGKCILFDKDFVCMEIGF